MLYAAKEKKSISNHEVDTRNVFLNEKECAKLSSVFFEELNESKERLAEQFNENMIQSPNSTHVFLTFIN